MSTAARIDELRKKFEENPRRYFAPLANEYRKAGDLPQAIALCREHLPKQPGHMSGYIVFGQALYESGELAEARSVFEQALDLDPENLIALRHLGDIARASGDASSARRWYERVLDADPRNDDIAAQLATLAATRTPISSPAVPSSQQPFARPVETPPIPMTPIGFGVMPTPDSVMRAVDLDAIASRVSRPTPLDLDAIEHAAASFVAPETPATETPAPAASSFATHVEHPSAPAPHPASLEPIDVGDDELVPTASSAPVSGDPAPEPVSAHAEPSVEADQVVAASPTLAHTPSPRDEADAFDFPEPTPSFSDPVEPGTAVPTVAAEHSAMVVEMASGQYGAVEMSDRAAEFEEGLVAPEWPDTSELVSRLATPRSLTPAYFTPVSSEAVADAVAAFGEAAREAPVAEPALAPDVEPIAAEPVAAETFAADAASEVDAADTLVEAVNVHAAYDVGAADHVDAAEATLFGDVASEIDDAVSDESMESAPAAEAAAYDVRAFVTPAFPTPAFPTPAFPTQAFATPAFASPVVQHVDADAAGEVSEQPGIEELAEAFADDARAVGDRDAVIVATVEEVVDSAEVASFADIAPDEPPDAFDVASSYATSYVEPVSAPYVSGSHDSVVHDSVVHDSVVHDSVIEEHVASFEDASDADFDGDVEAASTPAERVDESPAFVTETMAELLVSQGFIGRAVDVYEELVRRRPFDPVLDARLTELRGLLEPAPAASLVDEPVQAAASPEPVVTSEAETITESLFADDTAPAPAYGTPLYNTPISVPPVMATPAIASTALAAFEASPFDASPFDDSSSSASASEAPASEASASDVPASELPSIEAYTVSANVTPMSSPLVTPPSVGRITPYSQPAIDELAPRRSAREWFAMLAARRVPRRTPAQSSPAVEQSPEGLASLFGADTSHHDDSAARALADAFAPVEPKQFAAGASLDFEFARSTPGFGSGAVVPAMVTPVVPPRVSHATPAGTFAPVPPSASDAGNAGFAFDKFFPDPATRRGTPAAAMPVSPDAPVTDDLAQFSAWLKGLGNT